MGYVSLLELKQQLAILPSDGANDVDLQRAIDAGAAAIDNACGRTFAVDTTDQTRYYVPTAADVIEVVDLVAVTSVKTDTLGDRTYATTLTSSDYELLPYNEERTQQIRIWPTSSRGFTPGRLVQVVGRFGYAEGVDVSDALPANWLLGTPPVPIRQANLLLAARYYARKDAPFGILSAADIGAFARLSAEDPDVKTLLAPYNRRQVWVTP